MDEVKRRLKVNLYCSMS